MGCLQRTGTCWVAVVLSLGAVDRAVGQVTLDPAWPENPKLFEGAVADSVQQTTDGGYIVAGSTGSLGAGNWDAYLIKLDAAGNLDPAWNPNPKTFGGSDSDRARSVQQTTDGGYIVAGSTSSLGAGLADVYVIKLDAAGNLDPAWSTNPKTFGGESDDGAYCVRQTTDDGYVVAGKTVSFGAGRWDAYLIKLDAQGNLDATWSPNPKTFGGADNENAFSVEQIAGGGYVVAGSTESSGAGDADVYVIKLDAQGNLDPSWDPNPRTFGTKERDGAYCVLQTSDGGYVVVGASGSRTRRDVYLIKLDVHGNLDGTWDRNPKTVGGPYAEWAFSVQQTSDGEYIVAGKTSSFGAGKGDVYLMRLDARGNLAPSWDPNPRTFGGETDDWAKSVQQTTDGGFVVAGGGSTLLLKLAPARHFLRGDCNGDGSAQGVADSIFLLERNFAGGVRPPCLAACDADGDGKVAGTVTDAVYLLNHFFRGGAPPAPPYPACGAGQLWTDGPLGCETEPECP